MEKTFKCPHCDYVGKKGGYLEQHIRIKHKNQPIGGGQKKNIEGNKEIKTDGETKNQKCPDCKGDNLRLLNPRDKRELSAKNLGYKKICDDCEEVFE